MKYLNIIFFLFAINNLNAQIDTTDWYPLHIGDKWEYWGRGYWGGFSYDTVEVLGDTLMPNGKTYFKLTLYDRKYQRVENNRYVMVYNEYAKNNEFLMYKLDAVKGEIFVEGYGVYDTGEDNDNVLLKNLEWKEYREVYIDSTVTPPDTVWDEVVDGAWPRITKGLGVTSYAYGWETLVGAVINGEEIGTLVGVEENPEIVNEFKLHQNYPNPFNPNTTIKYSLSKDSQIVINIFNILGKKIKTLFEGFKGSGEHFIELRGSDLSSGTYFVQLVSGKNNDVIKIQLLK